MTAVLTSHQLVDRYELHNNDLHRWRARGWISPERIVRGGDAANPARASLWPDWTDRMVRLLLIDRDSLERGGNEEVRHRRNRMLADTAAALTEDPEVRWVVFVDDPVPVPCRHDHEVAAVLDGVRLWATIVAIPLSVTLDGTSIPA